MKRKLLAVALLFAGLAFGSAAAYAQALTVTVNNNTPCDVYYDLRGDNFGFCSQTYTSAGATITAGTLGVVHTAASFGANVITRFRAYQGDPFIACMPTPMGTAQVGGCLPAPFSTSINVWQYSLGTCSSCSLISVTWTATSPSTATIDLN